MRALNCPARSTSISHASLIFCSHSSSSFLHHHNSPTVPLRSKHFVTISDAGGASEDLALPGLLGFGRVELAFEEEEVSKKNEKGEATESVGGTKGSEQIRPRAALFVTDIGSEALVLVDGQPLAKKQKRLLRPGSVLSFRSVKGGEGDKEGEGGKEECEFELFRNEVAHA